MNIGLTYDLRSDYLALGYTEEETAEFDRDGTITAIESALQVLGYKTERIGNARKLTEYLVICKELLYQYHQPVLVEKYLSGRKFTVGIAGTGKNAKVLGTLEVLLLDGAEHSDLPILCNKLGISYVELINQIVTSAISRLPVKKAW
ncbi:MAG: hypothetical protein KKH20_10570 [Proteobacteria bacterium]|nr:hypothetical protein [Pseudomonadota bacterium]